MSECLESIRNFLRENGASFREKSHAPTRTSEESALARGERIEVGGKALVLKTGGIFRLFVLSAARKLDSRAIEAMFASKGVRFATNDELWDITKLEPGSVPPFGRPILDLELFIDESLAQNEVIAFNAGSLTHSIIMPMPDYLRIANGVVGRFSLSTPPSASVPDS